MPLLSVTISLLFAGVTLYTTLSPCPMCTRAILLSVVTGENKHGGNEAFLEEKGVKVIQLNDKKCIELLEKFAEKNPDVWYENRQRPSTK